MKKLKLFLTFVLVICLIPLVGCKKNTPKVDTPPGPSQNTPSNNAPSTNQEILKYTYSVLNEYLEKENRSGKSFVNSGGKNHYDTFVSQSISILNLISNLDSLQENVVFSGQKIQNENSSSSEEQDVNPNLSNEEFVPNAKIDTLKFLKYTSSSELNMVEIVLDAFFTRSNFDSNPLNFLQIEYNITYYIDSQKVDVLCYIENSFSAATYDGETTTSRADYYMFSFSSKWQRYDGSYFHRTTKFDYNDEDKVIDSRYIKNLDLVMFNLQTMAQDDISSQTGIEQNQNSIKSVLLESQKITDTLMSLTVEQTLDNLSEALVPIAESIIKIDQN